MINARASDLWWKNAIFYCLDVETFQDGNGDGCGDFAGLTQRIDYLDGLGVTCLWLMPFYPSPNRDDGYDITDYYSVDPRLGTLGDFVVFLRTARAHGIRVIADLVVNHTSNQHPWFQAARADRDSRYRNFYVWQDQPPADGPKGLVFPDQETSNWQYDEQAGQYYLHRFYKYQPDLNIGDPDVRDEIAKIAGFWLELGLSGFRVDAVPFLLELDGIAGRLKLDPHKFLRDLRAFLDRRRGDAILMGEVNLEPEDARRFFGDEDGDELQMCLNFNLNQSLALAMVREDAGPLIHGLRALPSVPVDDQWAMFVRNHDEWSLDKLTEAEREEAFAELGPKKDMQLYGRGIRRRLPTMLKGDQARIRMVYSLAFALPGSPILFYGEEIGMAENLAIAGSRERALADAMVGRGQRRLLDGRARSAAAPAGRGRMGAGDGQRRRPAARPELSVAVDDAADPLPAALPGDRLRRLAGAAEPAQGRDRAALRRRGPHRDHDPQPRPPALPDAARPRRYRGLARAHRPPGRRVLRAAAGRHAGVAARGLRPALVPGAQDRRGHGALTPAGPQPGSTTSAGPSTTSKVSLPSIGK